MHALARGRQQNKHPSHFRHSAQHGRQFSHLRWCGEPGIDQAVHQIRRQAGGDRILRGRGQHGQWDAGFQCRVGREPAGADGVRDDGHRVAPRRAAAGERFSGRQEFLQMAHYEHAGAVQRRAEYVISAARWVQQPAARADGDHGAQAGRGTRGADEGTAPAHAADVHQNKAGIGIARQPIQTHGEAEIGTAAQADDVTEADAVWGGPIHHGAGQRGGLGQ